MPKKTYSVFFNSLNASNRSGPGRTNFTYYVNWSKVIPAKYENRKFKMNWVFNSDATGNAMTSAVFVRANLGTIKQYDQTGQRSFLLGTVVPQMVHPTTFMYTNSEINDFLVIDYPTDSYVNIQQQDAVGTFIAGAPNCYIQLFFTLLDEDDILNVVEHKSVCWD